MVTDSRAALAARLLDAIGETERAALAAAQQRPWVQWMPLSDPRRLVAGDGKWWDVRPSIDTATDEIAEHISRHDPAAVLRRCAADRRMVKLWQVFHEAGNASAEMQTAADEFLRHIAEGIGITDQEEVTQQ